MKRSWWLEERLTIAQTKLLVFSFLQFPTSYLDGQSVAALGGDNTVVTVAVDLVVVDGHEVAVVVGVKTVRGVVVHLVPPPVSILMAERVDPEVVVVDVRVVDVAVDCDVVEHVRVALVLAIPSNLPASTMRIIWRLHGGVLWQG